MSNRAVFILWFFFMFLWGHTCGGMATFLVDRDIHPSEMYWYLERSPSWGPIFSGMYSIIYVLWMFLWFILMSIWAVLAINDIPDKDQKSIVGWGVAYIAVISLSWYYPRWKYEQEWETKWYPFALERHMCPVKNHPFKWAKGEEWGQLFIECALRGSNAHAIAKARAMQKGLQNRSVFWPYDVYNPKND